MLLQKEINNKRINNFILFIVNYQRQSNEWQPGGLIIPGQRLLCPGPFSRPTTGRLQLREEGQCCDSDRRVTDGAGVVVQGGKLDRINRLSGKPNFKSKK